MQTTWFERHGSTPITAVPAEWPDDYRQLVERRIAIIETDPNIRLIEQPEYKRRWNTEPWDSQLERALREWLLDRLESYLDFDGRMNDAGQVTAKVDIALISIAKLADVARQDAEFQQVGELYREDPAFDVHRLVTELVAAEVVPLLPALLYKESGLRKRAEWERTWELQREEDRLDVERQAAKEAEETECKRVKAQFSSEAHELEKQRAKLMELTRQLYEATGHSVPEFDPKYEAEIHASVLAGQGMKSLESLSNLLNQIEQIRELKRELTEKIAAALKTDSAYQEILNRLASIPLNPEISVPPKYTSADFISSGGARYWTLRGKLDVPKERWVSFPHCEGPDGTLVIAWAGYDHLQLARAISAYYVDVQERLGGRDDPRLIPLLASLIELLPWLKQWHNQIDSEFGMAMGDYFEGFVNEEAKQLGQTHEQIKAWTPPQRIKGRKR